MDLNEFQTYCALVEEFYKCGDSARLSEIDKILCRSNKDLNTTQLISLSFELFNVATSPTLQLHGSICLYEAIAKRHNDYIVDPILCTNIKGLLISLLLERFSSQPRSISNKQTAALAMFALQTMPDIWQEPILDVFQAFQGDRKLLLSFLSELAYQYRQIKVPYGQRSKLSAILERHNQDVPNYILAQLQHVSEPVRDTKIIAECMSNWLELPDLKLDEWSRIIPEYISLMKGDNLALSSLFFSLSKNEQLPRLPQLVLEIFKNIVTSVRQKMILDISQGDLTSDDLMLLIESITRLSLELSSNLIKASATEETRYILKNICELLSDVASYPALFALEETISDIPTPFFATLCEDLCDSNQELNNNAKNLVQDCYIKMLKHGISKVAWPKIAVYQTMDKLQKDEFMNYRTVRSNTALECFYVVGDETFSFLNHSIEEDISKGEWERVEASLFLLQMSSDALTERHFEEISKLLTICRKIMNLPHGESGDRMGITIMTLFLEIAHLIAEHDECAIMETLIYEFCVTFLGRESTIRSALYTLSKFASWRSESLKACGDSLLSYCHQVFANPLLENALKLEALKAIGYILSVRSDEEIIHGAINLLSPIFSELRSEKVDENGSVFKIKMITSLFSSIQPKNGQSSAIETPLSALLLRFYPYFHDLINTARQGEITEAVVNAMRTALIHLNDNQVPMLLSIYYEVLAITLNFNIKSSFELAGTLVLIVSKNSEESTRFIKQISSWATSLQTQIQTIDSPDLDLDDWMSLFYKVIKKEWATLRTVETSQPGSAFINSCLLISIKVLQTTTNIFSVKMSAQILTTIMSKTEKLNDKEMKLLIAAHGTQIFEAISKRLSTESTKSNIDLFAEIVFYFARNHPTETRSYLERYGTHMTSCLFQNLGHLHSFKILFNKLGHEVRKCQLVNK